jgi:hypothetical protein
MLGAQASVAQTAHPDQSGVDFDFTGTIETSVFSDPEPLFGAPTASGNALRFGPLTFSATAAGDGGFDQTAAQLQTTVTATGSKTIDKIGIDEFGDVDLSGVGTAATASFVSMSGAVTVTETTGGPIAPVSIPFIGTFAPSDLYGLPGDQGQTLWHGSVLVDVAAVVPDATKTVLSFDNDLTAASEPGTTALIQKKVVVILVVEPEPAE